MEGVTVEHAATLLDRIVHYEKAYLQSMRAERERYSSIPAEWPDYLTGCRRVEIYLARDGVVVARYMDEQDYYNVHAEGTNTILEIAATCASDWDQMETHLRSGGLSFQSPKGEAYAVQIRRVRADPLDKRSGSEYEHDDVGKILSMVITDAFDTEIWGSPLGHAEASSDIHTFVAAHLLGIEPSENQSDVADLERQAYEKYESMIVGFRDLLLSGPKEEPLQQYLANNPALLALDAARILPKFALGNDYITDFVLELAARQYVFVEIEAATHSLYTQERNPRKRKPSSGLNTALQQVEDWQEWMARNHGYVEDKLPDILYPEYWIVIGRTPKERRDRRAVEQRKRNLLPIRLFTYDDLLMRAERQLENLRK